jgi:hypothetical protein
MAMNFLGQFLLQRGAITEEQLADALEYRQEHIRRTGDLALEQGALTPRQVTCVLKEQEKTDQPFGEIALHRGYLSEEALDDILFSQVVCCVYLGEALLERGHLSQERFDILLGEYEQIESGRRMNVKYLYEDAPESKMLATLVVALDKAFTRFAGESAKVDSIGGEFNEDQYDHSFLLQAAMEEGSKILSRVYLSESTARGMAEAFPETKTTVDGAEPPELKRFFRIVNRYFRSGLELRGFTLKKPSRAVVAKAIRKKDPCPPGITVRLATPSGPVGVRMCIACQSKAT